MTVTERLVIAVIIAELVAEIERLRVEIETAS